MRNSLPLVLAIVLASLADGAVTGTGSILESVDSDYGNPSWWSAKRWYSRGKQSQVKVSWGWKLKSRHSSCLNGYVHT